MRRTLTTRLTTEEEIFAEIDFIASVPSAAERLFQSRGLPETEWQSAFKLLQAFLRQGKSFYEAAKELDDRASPLLYYYSALNFSKGLLCLSNPNLVSKKIPHGLTHMRSEAKLADQKVKVAHGVFQEIYKLLFSCDIPTGTELSLLRMMNYVPDISYELRVTGHTHPTAASVHASYCRGDQSSSFLLLSANDVQGVVTADNFPALFSHFSEVTIRGEDARNIFGQNAEHRFAMRYFQSSDVQIESGEGITLAPHLEILAKLRTSTELCCFDHQLSPDFYLQAPLCTLPFNTLLSIFGSLYYLSSLVRYQPDYLEHLLAANEAWLIRRFIGSAPEALLHLVFSRIVGETVSYHKS